MNKKAKTLPQETTEELPSAYAEMIIKPVPPDPEDVCLYGIYCKITERKLWNSTKKDLFKKGVLAYLKRSLCADVHHPDFQEGRLYYPNIVTVVRYIKVCREGHSALYIANKMVIENILKKDWFEELSFDKKVELSQRVLAWCRILGRKLRE